jgi:hypothetical protein
MRNPGWAGAALIAVALTVTACGTGSGSSAGGAYGYGNQATQAATTSASPSSVMTAALKTEATRAGTILANSHGLTLYYYSADKRGSGKSACTGGCATARRGSACPARSG